MPFDGKQIVDSWGALEFDSVPKRLCVVGAGVIGLELGSVWRRLGSEVVVLEALRCVPAGCRRCRLPRKRSSTSRSSASTFAWARRSAAPTKSASGVKLKYTDAKGEQTLEVDKVVVAIGRRPFTKDLLGDGTGVQIDERGFIKVDHDCKTDVANVWAVGDVVRGPMLAHKGKEEGVMVADLIAGKIAGK